MRGPCLPHPLRACTRDGVAMWVLLLAMLLSLPTGGVWAHERSESFSHWQYVHGTLDGIVTVHAREVTRLLLPGEAETEGSLERIFAAHIDNSVTAAIDGRPCAAVHSARALHADPGYLRVGVQLQCPTGNELEIHVGALFDVAPTHHHFIYVEARGVSAPGVDTHGAPAPGMEAHGELLPGVSGPGAEAPGAQREGILTVAAQSLRLDLGSSKPDDARPLQFVVMGMEHIATGIDHLAFLLALLITARSSRQVLLIVTGFTIGHSVTLTLAVTGLLEANRGAVEALIGLTIALAAARNLIGSEREGRIASLGALLLIGSLALVPAALRPDMPAGLIAAIALAAASFVWLGSTQPQEGRVAARFVMAMSFGLIHGLGFASALQDLHLPRRLLVSTLVGFNIGVEIGQLAAVGAALLLFRAARRLAPARMQSDTPALAVSAALLAMGIAWFLGRAVTVG